MKNASGGLRAWGRAAALVGLLAAACTPASAQGNVTQDQRRRPQPRPPIIRELPPQPLSPNSLGLLERDFQIMRQTSPDPNNFAGGRWNPRYEIVPQPRGNYYVPPTYGGGYYYGGGFYPYGGGLYPSYGYPNQFVPQYPNERVYIERQIIVVPPGQGGGAAPQQQQPQPQPQQPPQQQPQPPQNGDFYLRAQQPAAPSADSVGAALLSIRQAWLNGDVGRLQSHLPAEGKIRLFPRGKYAYELNASEFGAMSRDAMTRLDTTEFTLGQPVMRSADEAFVSGRHSFRPATAAGVAPGETTTVYVSYLLRRIDGRWRIVEAGSSSTPLSAHVN